MNILHEKRKLAPYGNPQEPVTAFIMANAATIATSAAIGAVSAAVSGGNILKGALLGAITGGIAAGVSEAFGAASSVVESGQGISTAAAGEGLKVASTAAEVAMPAAEVASTATQAASPFSIAPAQSAVTSGLPQAGGLLSSPGSGLAIDVTKTGIGTMPASPAFQMPKSTGLMGNLSKLADSKVANTGLLLGGQMLMGASQEKAQQEEIKRRQTNAAYTAAPVRGVYQ